MKNKDLSRRRFAGTTSAALITSGCVMHSGKPFDFPVETGGWSKPDRFVHPFRDARAAVSRRRAGRQHSVLPSVGVLGEVRHHAQTDIAAVHGLGTRVVVVVKTHVRLLSDDLQEATIIASTPSIHLASGHRELLIPRKDGRVARHRARDGKRFGVIRPHDIGFPVEGMLFRPPFLILSSREPENIHASRAPRDTQLELTRLYRVRSKEGGQIALNRPARIWMGGGSGPLVLAAHGPTVVSAMSNGFTWFDWGLNIRTAQPTGRWDYPLDEALDVAVGPGDAAHALYSTHPGTVLVSCASPSSKAAIVFVDMDIPPDVVKDTAWSPLPGPDGRVILAPPGQILCFDSAGKLLFQYRRNGSAPALLVDGGILVEHDAALFKLDWAGKFQHIWTAPAPLTARPLYHDGYWYVASGTGLHQLVGVD